MAESNPVCLHEHFSADVEVDRLQRGEGGEVYAFLACIRVQCTQCGSPFVFEGLPRGLNIHEPMAGVMGIEARLPIHAITEADKTPETLRFTVPA